MKRTLCLCVAFVVIGATGVAWAAEEAEADSLDLAYVSVRTANVRSGPGTAHSIVLRAHWGDELEVLSRGVHWLRVVHRDSEKLGWIHGDLVSVEHPGEAPPPKKTTQRKGTYGRYSYTYVRVGSRYAVTFRPFLPRDDSVVIGAMLELINSVYGKHLVTNLTPDLVPREGTNAIRFKGKKHDYLFLLLKEDTGEVHSFRMWRESR